jgi:hypothetical protein
MEWVGVTKPHIHVIVIDGGQSCQSLAKSIVFFTLRAQTSAFEVSV